VIDDFGMPEFLHMPANVGQTESKRFGETVSSRIIWSNVAKTYPKVLKSSQRARPALGDLNRPGAIASKTYPNVLKSSQRMQPAFGASKRLGGMAAKTYPKMPKSSQSVSRWLLKSIERGSRRFSRRSNYRSRVRMRRSEIFSEAANSRQFPPNRLSPEC
jgi:hypothetical protein